MPINNIAVTFRTEAAAWTAIADTIEMLGELPPFYRKSVLGWSYDNWLTYVDNRPCRGLCDVVTSLYHEGLITWQIQKRMHARISRTLDQLNRTWLATPGEWPSRVYYARLFATQARHGRAGRTRP